MPQANDAELTELYTTALNVDVENDEPNAQIGAPANTFNLRLQAVAGNVIGGGGGNYTLRADCIDETLAARNAGMSVGPLNQAFNNAPGNDWTLTVDGSFVKEQTAVITRDPGGAGHVFRYVGSLVSANGDVVSFIESNKFILL